MSLLPNRILPQSVPLGRVDGLGQLMIDQNWYLFLYNLALQTFAVPGASGPSPASPYDLLDMADLDAEGADIPQAYRMIAGLQSEHIEAADGADICQANRSIAGIQKQQFEGADGADVAALAARMRNLEAQTPTEDVAITLQQLANAILLAVDALLQDPMPPAGAVIPIAAGASPFTYTALHDGTFFASGTASTNINVIRYGVSVPTGITDGAIPMRKNDQVSLTWSGSTAPTMNFLPNK